MIRRPKNKYHTGINIVGGRLSNYNNFDDWAIHKNIANEFEVIPLKSPPHINDEALIEDLQDSNKKKKIKLLGLINQDLQNVGTGWLKVLASSDQLTAEFRSLSSLSSVLTTFQDSTDIYFDIDQGQINIDLIGDGELYKKYTLVERDKLQTVEEGADKTDIDNVTAAEHLIPVSAHQDIFSPGVDIEDAVSLRHVQGTDTTLGILIQNIDMGLHRIINVKDPIYDTDAVNLKTLVAYSDEHAIHWDRPAEISQAPLLQPYEVLVDNDLVLIEKSDSADPDFQKRSVKISQFRQAQSSAYHYDVANEFNRSPTKIGDISTSYILLEDYDDNLAKKSAKLNMVYVPNIDSASFHENRSAEFSGLTFKAILNDYDVFVFEDSESVDPVSQKRGIYAKDLRSNNFDEQAIHKLISNEFSVIPVGIPVPGAQLIGEFPVTGEKFRFSFSDIPTAYDPNAIHKDIYNEIYGIETKSGDPSNDWLVLEEDSLVITDRKKKKIRISALPTGGGGEANVGINIGDGFTKLYAGKDGIALQFYSFDFQSPLAAVRTQQDRDTITVALVTESLHISADNVDVTADRRFCSLAEKAVWDAAAANVAVLDGASFWFQGQLISLSTRITGNDIDIYSLQNSVEDLEDSVSGLDDQVQYLNDYALLGVFYQGAPNRVIASAPRYFALGAGGNNLLHSRGLIAANPYDDGDNYLYDKIDITTDSDLFGNAVNIIGIKNVITKCENITDTTFNVTEYKPYQNIDWRIASYDNVLKISTLNSASADINLPQNITAKRPLVEIKEGVYPDGIRHYLSGAWWATDAPRVFGENEGYNYSKIIMTPIHGESTRLNFYKIGAYKGWTNPDPGEIYKDRLYTHLTPFDDDVDKGVYVGLLPRLTVLTTDDFATGKSLLGQFEEVGIDEGYYDSYTIRKILTLGGTASKYSDDVDQIEIYSDTIVPWLSYFPNDNRAYGLIDRLAIVNNPFYVQRPWNIKVEEPFNFENPVLGLNYFNISPLSNPEDINKRSMFFTLKNVLTACNNFTIANEDDENYYYYKPFLGTRYIPFTQTTFEQYVADLITIQIPKTTNINAGRYRTPLELKLDQQTGRYELITDWWLKDYPTSVGDALGLNYTEDILNLVTAQSTRIEFFKIGEAYGGQYRNRLYIAKSHFDDNENFPEYLSITARKVEVSNDSTDQAAKSLISRNTQYTSFEDGYLSRLRFMGIKGGQYIDVTRDENTHTLLINLTEGAGIQSLFQFPHHDGANTYLCDQFYNTIQVYSLGINSYALSNYDNEKPYLYGNIDITPLGDQQNGLSYFIGLKNVITDVINIGQQTQDLTNFTYYNPFLSTSFDGGDGWDGSKNIAQFKAIRTPIETNAQAGATRTPLKIEWKGGASVYELRTDWWLSNPPQEIDPNQNDIIYILKDVDDNSLAIEQYAIGPSIKAQFSNRVLVVPEGEEENGNRRISIIPAGYSIYTPDHDDVEYIKDLTEGPYYIHDLFEYETQVSPISSFKIEAAPNTANAILESQSGLYLHYTDEGMEDGHALRISNPTYIGIPNNALQNLSDYDILPSAGSDIITDYDNEKIFKVSLPTLARKSNTFPGGYNKYPLGRKFLVKDLLFPNLSYETIAISMITSLKYRVDTLLGTNLPLIHKTVRSNQEIVDDSYTLCGLTTQHTILPENVQDIIEGQLLGQAESVVIKGIGLIFKLLLLKSGTKAKEELNPANMSYGIVPEPGRTDGYYKGNIKIRNLSTINEYENEEILSWSLDTYDPSILDDTVCLKVDPLKIKRLGVQSVDLDMGTNRVTNIGMPISTNDAIPLSMYNDVDLRISTLEAIAHLKDHDSGTDPLDENLDMGGDETSIRRDAVPGIVIPHKVVNQADADWGVPTDGVNMRTLIDYVASQNFAAGIQIKTWSSEVQGDLNLTQNDFNCCYLLSVESPLNIKMPFISGEYFGQTVSFYIVNGNQNITLLPFSGQTIRFANNVIKNTLYKCLTLIADIAYSWDLFSSNYDSYAFHSNSANEFSKLIEKDSIDVDDVFVIEDSESSNIKSNIKAFVLKEFTSKFDTEIASFAEVDHIYVQYNKFYRCWLYSTSVTFSEIRLPPIESGSVGMNICICLENRYSGKVLKIIPSPADNINGQSSYINMRTEGHTMMFVSNGIDGWLTFGSSFGAGILELSPLGDSVPEFFDNASAISGGIPQNCLYRTGDVLKVVHL